MKGQRASRYVERAMLPRRAACRRTSSCSSSWNCLFQGACTVAAQAAAQLARSSVVCANVRSSSAQAAASAAACSGGTPRRTYCRTWRRQAKALEAVSSSAACRAESCRTTGTVLM